MFADNAKTRPTLAGINYTRIFGPAVVNEFRAGLVRTSDNESAVQRPGHQSALGLPPVRRSEPVRIPAFHRAQPGRAGRFRRRPVEFTANNYEVADVVIGAGRHMIKFGADLLRTQYFQAILQQHPRQLTISWAAGPPCRSRICCWGDRTARRGRRVHPAYWFYTDWGVFVQDQYRGDVATDVERRACATKSSGRRWRSMADSRVLCPNSARW